MKALGLTLALWGVCGRLWAVETAVKAPTLQSVQLSLDFSAKPVLPAFAPGLPALTMPLPVAQALNGGAHEFYRAVVAHDWQIPHGDDRQESMFAEGAERAAADLAFRRLSQTAAILGKAPSKPAKKTKIDYDVFGTQLSRAPGLSTNVFRDTQAKRRILLTSGYTHLTGPGGRRIPIAQAADARVGKAFENVLSAYNRRD